MIQSGMGLHLYQLVGAVGESKWSQVRSLRLANGVRRELLVLLKLEGVTASERGMRILDEIFDAYEAVGKGGMDWLRTKKDEVRGRLEEGAILMAEIVDDKKGVAIYVTGVGMKMVLERGERSQVILNQDEGVVSGWLKEGDVLVMGSDQFMEGVWTDEEGELESRVDAARMVMRVGDNSVGEVGLVARVGAAEVEEGEKQEGEVALPKTEEEKEIVKEFGKAEVFVTPEERKKNRLMKALKRKMSGGGVHLRETKVKRKGLGVILGAVFLGLFVFSVVVGAKQSKVRQEKSDYQEVAEPVEYALNEAESIFEVNPVRARTLVDEARGKVGEQGSRFEETVAADDWVALKNRVEEVWRRVSGEETVVAEKWMDTSLIKEGMEAKKLGLEQRHLLVADDRGGLLKIELSDKSGEIVAGDEVENLLAVGGNEDEANVLLKDKILRIDLNTGEVIQELDLEGVKGMDVDGFGGNIYLLAEEDVFKFPYDPDGIGSRRRYLEAGIEVNVEEAVAMSIDGDIWVVRKDGLVYQLSSGRRSVFELKNFSNDWMEIAGIAASQETNEVYVWDRGRSRVVIFDRENGEYKRQLLWEGFRDANDLVMDEENSRLLVGRGSEIWMVGL